MNLAPSVRALCVDAFVVVAMVHMGWMCTSACSQELTALQAKPVQTVNSLGGPVPFEQTQQSKQSAASNGSSLAQTVTLKSYVIVDDRVPSSLAEGYQPNALRGAKIAHSREGQCTLCHAFPDYTGQVGNLGPDLRGVGSRLSLAQLRLRIIDESKFNADTIMPSFYKVQGLINVDPKWQGKPLMDEQQIEDVVLYLSTLR
jgi:sulfur-oxidizing protein SoxX